MPELPAVIIVIPTFYGNRNHPIYRFYKTDLWEILRQRMKIFGVACIPMKTILMLLVSLIISGELIISH